MDMFKTLFHVLAEKFLETVLKLNGAKKISEEDFRAMILRNDPKAIGSLSDFLNISKEDVKNRIEQYKKLLEKNKK